MSTTGASKAVELSILALASLFRNGDNSQTARYKFGALNALMFCLEEGVNRMSSIMHIAAGILLCVFEVRAHLDHATIGTNSVRVDAPRPAI
jgi:hypothetical protein